MRRTSMALNQRIPLEFLGELERSLAGAPMCGVPLGSTLNDVVNIDLINGQGRWGIVKWLRRRCAEVQLTHRPARRPRPPVADLEGKVLVTWRSLTSRIDELLLPVIGQLGADRCAVLYDKKEVIARVPPGTIALRCEDSVPHDRTVWLSEFRRCRPFWKATVKAVCRQFLLKAGIYQRLWLELVHASQFFAGCRQLLEALRPAAVLTEYDRSARWSCLVLAARSLRIPTFTLQHGVLADGAFGYVPLLADRIFCWGELHRQTFLQAGEDPRKLLLGGCPRLTRDIAADPASVRSRLGLDPRRAVVVLGTSPIDPQDRARLTEVFCNGMNLLGNAVGIVRLHPSEKLDTCSEAMRRYPGIHFVENRQMTLDEAMAAADIIVVHNSGFGSDALVKRRPVAIIDVPGSTLGHGSVLAEQAGCPKAVTAEELAAVLDRTLHDADYRAQLSAAAERFVGRFCAYFGEDSARRIAEGISESVGYREAAAI